MHLSPSARKSRSKFLHCKCDEREQAAFRGGACVPKSLAAVKFAMSLLSARYSSKGRTLDHRRSEQQQAPVAESLRLPPAEHGGRKWALETPHLHDRTRLEHSGRHSTPPG